MSLELRRAELEHATALVQHKTARLEVIAKIIELATAATRFAAVVVAAAGTTGAALLLALSN